MKYRAIILLSLSLLTMSAFADDLSTQAYCNYDHEKAEAERLIDQMPTALIGFGRSNTATGNVLGLGVSESLSKFLQGNLSHKIGDADCHLYQITTEIQKHVRFDMLSLQLQSARNRLSLTEDGISQLDVLISDENARRDVGSSTIQNVATLQAAKETLIVAKANLEQEIASIVLPPISDEQLNSLLVLANVYNLEEQQAQAKQSKLQNWDVTVTVGEGSNPNLPMFRSFPNQTYATAQFSYSFGTIRRNKELSLAAKDYVDAVATNPTGPITLAHLLRAQVTQARDAAQESLGAFKTYNVTLQDQAGTVASLDSEVARSFKVQLAVAQISNNIELKSNQQIFVFMDQYLVKNFSE